MIYAYIYIHTVYIYIYTVHIYIYTVHIYIYIYAHSIPMIPPWLLIQPSSPHLHRVAALYFVLQGTPGKSAETEELLLHPGGDAVPRTVEKTSKRPSLNGSQKMGKHPGTRMVP